jgi:hypothetical protein
LVSDGEAKEVLDASSAWLETTEDRLSVLLGEVREIDAAGEEDRDLRYFFLP